MNDSKAVSAGMSRRGANTRTSPTSGALAVALGLSAACSSANRAVEAPAFELNTGAAREDAQVVISEVYGGGGNVGATFTHDYVELFNRSAVPVSLSGYSLQYTSAAGTTSFGASASLLTALPSVVLAPGQSFLVQGAQGDRGSTRVPGVDHVDTSPLNLSAESGKLALVRSTRPLACNGSTTPCSPQALAAVVDLVGFGSANLFEGEGPAAAPGRDLSVSRRDACLDTDDNAADFVSGAPSPTGSAAPPSPCAPSHDAGQEPGLSDDAGIAEAGVQDAASAHVVTADAASEDAGEADSGVPESRLDAGVPTYPRIHDLQGRAHVSPWVGEVVTSVPGIVTFVRSNGFYLQDPEPDADEATSEALFVFTGAVPTVAVGDSVLVDGRVSEYRPACTPSCSPRASAFSNLSTTQIERPTRVTVVAQGEPLPAATLIGRGGRTPPGKIIDDDTSGPDVQTGPTTFDPHADGLDFYESLEAMRVQVNDAVAVGPTQTFGRDARELAIVPDGGDATGPRSARGGIVVTADDFNPERIFLANTLLSELPEVNVGARFSSAIEGLLDYGYGNYKLYFTAKLPSVVPSALEREVTTQSARNQSELTVATFNVENLSPRDSASKFETLAELLVTNLAAPDLVALEEVQDDNGPLNDGVVTATRTYATLIAAIQAAGGPTYDFRSIDPADDQDGGQPGGNIRVGFLFRTDRALSFVDRPGASHDTKNAVLSADGAPHLQYSPGRIDPQNAAFSDSRKPLAAELRVSGRSLFVIVNHFNSKGGDQPLFGRFQPPVRGSEAQRLAQARVVSDFVAQIRAVDPAALVVVLGDLNDFEFSAPVSVLEAVGLTSLVETLPLKERYSYVYQGNSQVLDHIMVSPGLLSRTVGFDIVHVNAEFASQASDHDPSLARFAISPSN